MHAIRAARVLFALLFSIAAGTALAQRASQTDAANRAILDASGRRLTYSTPGIQRPAAAQPARSPDHILAGGSRRFSIQSVQTAQLSAGPNYADQWRYLTWGTGIGLTGFWPVDIDNDGTLEFVTGGGWGFGHNNYWSVVGYDAVRQGYRILWQSPADSGPTTDGITALRLVEAGGTKRVWLGHYMGSIEVVDALTKASVATIAPASGTINDFAFADADNDGSLDVVALTSTNLYIYNASTAALVRTLNYGGDRLAVGNVDNDPNLEIVLSSGKILEVVSASTTVQRDGAAFGFDMALADIDADGRQELVVSEGWYHVKAWDLDIPAVKWDHPTSTDIGALRLFDVTGDAVPEVLFGDGQWGSVHALAADTGSELWSVNNPEHGVTDIAVFDADHDGQLELLWGAGWSSSGPDYLYVHDLATRAKEWQSVDFTGPYRGVDVGDVDGDGQLELVAASVSSQNGGGSVLAVLNAVTHELEWQKPATQILGPVGALRVVNVDSDPQPEIVLAAGSLYILDGVTHAVQLEQTYDGELQALAVADVDGDGKPEIVAGNSSGSTGGLGIYIYVIDPANGNVIWKSASFAAGIASMRDVLVADVGAPGADIVALVDGFVHRVRWSDKQLLSTSTGNFTSIAVADALGNGQPQIVAGRSDGVIEILDPDTLANVGSVSVCSGQVPAIHEHDPKLLAFVCGSSFGIYDVAAQSLVTQTDTKVSELGAFGAIVRATIAGKSAYLLGGYQAIELLDISSNDIPSMDAASYSVHWRASFDIGLTGSDANGDALRFDLAEVPTKGSVLWTDRSAGVLRYSVAHPAKGTDVFRARAFDGLQYSSPQAISLTLTNTAPTASTTALSLHWRGAQTLKLAGSDTDGDPLTFSIGSVTQKGALTVTDATTGDVQFVPAGAFVGSDSLTYQVSDGADASAMQTVQVNLTNTAPSVQAASYDLTAGTTLSARVNGQDANSDPLTYEIVQQPTKGTFTLESSTGQFQYVPASGGSGTDTVTVIAGDGIARSQSATLEFRYPGGRKGGGGRLEWLTLLLLVIVFAIHQRGANRRRLVCEVGPRHGRR